MSQKTIIPIAGTKNKLFIRPETKERVSAGGIVLPSAPKESAEEVRTEGIVVAISEIDDLGQKPQLSVGDFVIFPGYAAKEVTFEGIDYLVMKESEVYAKIV